jgi:peptidoglycan/LPS O-acetylase OafA/YrhL
MKSNISVEVGILGKIQQMRLLRIQATNMIHTKNDLKFVSVSMKQQLAGLNGLRAISIILVIGYHFAQHGFLPVNGLFRYFSFVFNGPFGVNIFFVISGFLITWLLLQEEARSDTHQISLRKFYIRRVFRIFPAYYFLLLVYALLSIAGFLHLSSTTWIASLTYTRQFFPEANVTTHLWSLSVEECFYLIWPVLFLLFPKQRTFIAIAVILIVTVARFFQYQYPQPFWVNSIFSTGDALMMGCLLAMHKEKMERTVLKMRKWTGILIPALIGCILIDKYLYHLEGVATQMNQPHPTLNIMAKLGYAFFGNIGLVTNIFIGLLVIAAICLNGLGNWW